MAFVGGDIQAALGAGWPELTHQLDGTLDTEDPATLFGVGATMNAGAPDPPPGPSPLLFLLVAFRRIVRR